MKYFICSYRIWVCRERGVLGFSSFASETELQTVRHLCHGTLIHALVSLRCCRASNISPQFETQPWFRSLTLFPLIILYTCNRLGVSTSDISRGLVLSRTRWHHVSKAKTFNRDLVYKGLASLRDRHDHGTRVDPRLSSCGFQAN